MAARFTKQMPLDEFERTFPNEQACWTYLLLQRWPSGPTCPRCGNTKLYESTARPWHWQCTKCGPKPRSPYRFSLKTGTIFEETKKPLKTWFKVLHLMLTSKKGISAAQIHRLIGSGSYETAWYMCMRLRGAMHDPDFQQLMGIVEIDETHIGGKQENRRWNVRHRYSGRGAAHTGKTTVIGAISRKGSVVCQVIEKANARTLSGFVRKAVSDRVDLVATDEHLGYERLRAMGYAHERVTHSTGEYVRGEVHTNNIESFWSLLKRGVMGTYHHVSAKYLPLYLAEFQFRHNKRSNPDVFGSAVRCS